jgi:hypothetical protein
VGNHHGKPVCPKMPEKPCDDLSLFVGPSSWSFFEVMKWPGNFLKKPVVEWLLDEEYKAAEEVVRNMVVVNDGAERGVKLTHDFLDAARYFKR